MEISSYIRSLRERLEELGIEEKIIDKVASREYATLSGVHERELKNLMTQERLDIIIASTASRINAQSQQESKISIDFKKNNVPQDSCTTDEQTILPVSNKAAVSENAARPVSAASSPKPMDDADATLFHTVKRSPSFDTDATKQLHGTKEPKSRDASNRQATPPPLPSDTATIVISNRESKDNAEEKTVVVPGRIRELLNETATVKISEKDIGAFSFTEEIDTEKTATHIPPVFFDAEKDAPKVAEKDVPDLNEEETIPMELSFKLKEKADRSTQAKQADEENAKKKETKPSESKKAEADKHVSSETDIVTAEALRNPHARRTFSWLLLLFFPTLLAVIALIIVTWLVGNLLLLLAFVSICALYLVGFFLPLFTALYSLSFGILYLSKGRGVDALGEIGIALFGLGLSLLWGFFLYRPFLKFTDTVGGWIRIFNKKILLLVRNLCRYSVKGVENL